MFLGTVADLTQIAHHMPKSDAQELAAAVTIAFSGTLLNKTYLKGFAGLVDAAESAYRGDPEGAGVGRAMENYAGSLVPALVAQHARQIDPVVRDVRGVMDAIYARTPTWAKYAGLKTSEDVPPMRDLYGRPTLREGLTDWAVDMALPFQTKTPVDEPGLRAIVENNVAITPLSRTLVGPGEKDLVVDPRAAGMTPGVSLKPHEYDRWGELVRTTKLGGKTLKEKLDALVESDHFQRQSVGPEGGQAMLLKQQVLIYRQVAKQKLFMENDREILKRVENYYREKASKLRPSRAVEAEPGTSVDSGSAGSGAPEVSGDIANIVR
jgi:hypothetical protein